MSLISILHKKQTLSICVLLFLSTITIYSVLSPGPTHFNYFTRLAESFTQLNLYTQPGPTWLNELIPFNGKYYVALPPMPAILMVPFVVFFKNFFSETYFSILIAGTNVILVYLLLRKMNFSTKISFFVSLFFAFGTNHLFLASVGSSWYIAHIVSLLFLLLSLIETVTKKRFFLIGVLIGMAFWSRTSTIFTLPFFYVYLWKSLFPIKRDVKKISVNFHNILNLSLLHLPIFTFILIDALYNYLRFGDPSPLAPYRHIQNVDPYTIVNGVYVSLSYIPRHIDALLFRLPKITSEFPYIIPSLYSTAIWFTSPLIIYAFKFKKNLLTLACWGGIIPTLFVIMQWAGVGFSQFGYRFAHDFMPLILILIALGLGKKPSKFAYTLLILSIFVNLWGTIVINKFNLYFM